MLLYRPLGLFELRLLAEAEWRAWPPRLPEQPHVSPVLSFQYARTIARDWNTKDERSGFLGFVSRFQVDGAFAQRYPVQRAGARRHEELWIPADELMLLNQHIRGFIEIIEAFAGPQATAALDPLS